MQKSDHGRSGILFSLKSVAAVAVPLLVVPFACQSQRSVNFSTLWNPAGEVTRAETLVIAQAYTKHRWKPQSHHAYHGSDPRGIRVDTPDEGYQPAGGVAGWWKPGSTNTGIPYKWGGFDTPMDFDAGLARGSFAGDVFTPQKRTLNNNAVSQHAVGVDCSGFISRCWKLSAPFSTYEIHKLCDKLPDFDSLKPGDVVNKASEHVSLFVNWQDSSHKIMNVYDVGCPPNWRVVMHGCPVDWLLAHGYSAWRYRGIRD